MLHYNLFAITIDSFDGSCYKNGVAVDGKLDIVAKDLLQLSGNRFTLHLILDRDFKKLETARFDKWRQLYVP